MNAFLPAAFFPSTCPPAEEDRLLSILFSEERDENLALTTGKDQARSPMPFTTNVTEFILWKTKALRVDGCIQIPP